MPQHQLVGGFCPLLLKTGSTGLPLTLAQPASPLLQHLHYIYSGAQLLPPPSGSLFLIANVRRGIPTLCASVGAAQLASRLVALEKATKRLEHFFYFLQSMSNLTEAMELTLTTTLPATATSISTIYANEQLTLTQTEQATYTSTITEYPTYISTITLNPTEYSTITINPTEISTITLNPTEISTITLNPTYTSTVTELPTYISTITSNPVVTITLTETGSASVTLTTTLPATEYSTSTITETETQTTAFSTVTETETLSAQLTLTETKGATYVSTITETETQSASFTLTTTLPATVFATVTVLLEDIKAFLDPETRAWYSRRGIPYRKGYLLYGPPGTGKSSLSLSIAGACDLDIYILNISSVDDSSLGELFTELPARCVILLEDIDAVDATQSRQRKTVKTSKDETSSSIEGKPQGKASLSALHHQ
ncbi:hypothetical protein B0J14DRAFT_645679 [Halenospora varia]|nr:hypothetical protein B0J14DRAFT_645679 [Halenospora varia]